LDSVLIPCEGTVKKIKDVEATVSRLLNESRSQFFSRYITPIHYGITQNDPKMATESLLRMRLIWQSLDISQNDYLLDLCAIFAYSSVIPVSLLTFIVTAISFDFPQYSSTSWSFLQGQISDPSVLDVLNHFATYLAIIFFPLFIKLNLEDVQSFYEKQARLNHVNSNRASKKVIHNHLILNFSALVLNPIRFYFDSFKTFFQIKQHQTSSTKILQNNTENQSLLQRQKFSIKVPTFDVENSLGCFPFSSKNWTDDSALEFTLGFLSSFSNQKSITISFIRAFAALEENVPSRINCDHSFLAKNFLTSPDPFDKWAIIMSLPQVVPFVEPDQKKTWWGSLSKGLVIHQICNLLSIVLHVLFLFPKQILSNLFL